MNTQPRLSLCILNCYPKASRDAFDSKNIGHPHDMFIEVLRRCVPEAAIDVLFPADPGASFPSGAGLASYDGYVWTGSDLTIYHLDDERVVRQIEFAKALLDAGARCCGSCWAMQMAAVAAGGEVEKNPNGREWGLARGIRLTDAGRVSPYMAGKPELYDAFSMHLDRVSKLPPGGTLLAVNDLSGIQALEVRKGDAVFWATQYHPEYNMYEMARLIRGRTKPLIAEGFFPDEPSVLEHADRMLALHARPADESLRKALSAGPEVLDPGPKEAELRNWVDSLLGLTPEETP